MSKNAFSLTETVLYVMGATFAVTRLCDSRPTKHEFHSMQEQLQSKIDAETELRHKIEVELAQLQGKYGLSKKTLK